ncbi:DUF6338 family protein [Glycomyces sp. A-F 0318]|uniref:DUF6338 family protein n=1 Tax=Glycomyces amatae TaxID=2881355 RepID=UPI001E3E3E50|nr:DUF6338 family protein [Glycomyces amatae]
MPTTFTQLALFVLLALPGLPYLAVRRRERSDLDRSVLRETVNVVAAGFIADVIAIFPAWLIATWWPAVALDVGALIANAPAYLAHHYTRAGLWLLVVLLTAAAIAYSLGRLVNWRVPTHPSSGSSWDLLCHGWLQGRPMRVGCELDDGSWLEGDLGSANTDITEHADRDVILVQPLHAIEPEQMTLKPLTDFSAVCVSARNIRVLYVTYLDRQAEATSSAAAVVNQISSAAASDGAPTSMPPEHRPPDVDRTPL